MIVADVLAQWPQTIPVFHKYQTACVGCDIAPFDTLADVARIYELDLEQFLHDLKEAIGISTTKDFENNV